MKAAFRRTWTALPCRRWCECSVSRQHSSYWSMSVATPEVIHAANVAKERQTQAGVYSTDVWMFPNFMLFKDQTHNWAHCFYGFCGISQSRCWWLRPWAVIAELAKRPQHLLCHFQSTPHGPLTDSRRAGCGPRAVQCPPTPPLHQSAQRSPVGVKPVNWLPFTALRRTCNNTVCDVPLSRAIHFNRTVMSF